MNLDVGDGWIGIANPRLLPYMATVHQACIASGLEPYVPTPPFRFGQWRVVYISGDFGKWVIDELPAVQRRYSDDPIPMSQLESELRQFCWGDPLVYGADCRCLEPVEKCVWELKTLDLRLFGWFVVKDVFVVHRGGDANFLHQDRSNYTPLVDATSAFRDMQRLLPRHIQGVRSEYVFSNRPG